MHRLGIELSYTLEASFGGSTIGARAGTHLGLGDLEEMGKHICDTLLDFFDPDPTKKIYCQNEILAKIKAELIRKYGESNIPTDPNELHEIESDTSGSDSSSDDGLPAHIEALHEAQVIVIIHFRFHFRFHFRLRLKRKKDELEKSGKDCSKLEILQKNRATNKDPNQPNYR